MRQRLVAVPRALSGWLWLFQDLSDRLTTLDVLLHEIEDDTTEAAALAGARAGAGPHRRRAGSRGGWSCVRWRRSSPASTPATTCPTLGQAGGRLRPGRAHRAARASARHDDRRHRLRVPLRADAPALLDRLQRHRWAPRPVALRHAGLRGAPGQLPGDRDRTGPPGALVPPGPRAGARRHRPGVAVLERVDVRVPHAAAGDAQRPGHVDSRDVPVRGAGANRLLQALLGALGDLGVGVQRSRPGRQLSVQGLRRARARAQARAWRRPRRRAVRVDAGRLAAPPRADRQSRRARRRRALEQLRLLRRRRLHGDAACTPARAGRSWRP